MRQVAKRLSHVRDVSLSSDYALKFGRAFPHCNSPTRNEGSFALSRAIYIIPWLLPNHKGPGGYFSKLKPCPWYALGFWESSPYFYPSRSSACSTRTKATAVTLATRKGPRNGRCAETTWIGSVVVAVIHFLTFRTIIPVLRTSFFAAVSERYSGSGSGIGVTGLEEYLSPSRNILVVSSCGDDGERPGRWCWIKETSSFEVGSGVKDPGTSNG